MPRLTLTAALSCALAALPGLATAQLSYKCGNSYSQTPCPDAVVLDKTDQRTSAQKAQADQATQRDARLASTMEKARLQQEAKNLAANTPATKASRPASASKHSADKTKKVRVKKAVPPAAKKEAAAKP
jgi:G3E family GTPase